MKLRKDEKNLKESLARIYVKEGKTLYLETAEVMVNEVFDNASRKDKKATRELGRLLRIYKEETKEET